MALKMKEKYERIDLSKLPDAYKEQFTGIKENTENFDPDYVQVEQENFDLLYDLVEKRFPDAIQKGGTVTKTKPSTKKKVTPKKKEEPEPEKKFKPRSRGMAKMKKADDIEECRKILSDAGYEYKRKVTKSGKKSMKVRVQRQERTIIKDKVDDTFKTVLKDISGSKEKDEKYAQMQKALSELQGLMTKLFNYLNNLAEDNSIEKVEKIASLLKKIIP